MRKWVIEVWRGKASQVEGLASARVWHFPARSRWSWSVEQENTSKWGQQGSRKPTVAVLEAVIRICFKKKKKNFALYLSGMGSPWESSEPGDWYLIFILIRSLLWRIHKGPMESRRLMDFVIIQLYLLNGTFSSLKIFSPFCCSFPFYSTSIITHFLFTFIYNLWALEFFQLSLKICLWNNFNRVLFFTNSLSLLWSSCV